MMVDVVWEVYEDVGIEDFDKEIEVVFVGVVYLCEGLGEVVELFKLFGKSIMMLMDYC